MSGEEKTNQKLVGLLVKTKLLNETEERLDDIRKNTGIELESLGSLVFINATNEQIERSKKSIQFWKGVEHGAEIIISCIKDAKVDE